MLPVNFEYAVEITKAYEEEGRWIVEGYAATSDFDMQEDIITEEAIRASAMDLIENSTVLHNHNPDESVGRVLESKARPGGLFLKILISKTVPDIWQQVKEGVLNKFSVRGKILEARKEWIPRLRKFARLILKMRLVEVSLVAVPANPKARAIRWYVEKALDEFEKSGGEMESETGQPDFEGEYEMEDDVIIEELLEAEGDPEGGKPAPQPETGGGDPPPENVSKQEGEAKPDNRMTQIVGLVDKLLAVVTDANHKNLLSQIRAIAGGSQKKDAPDVQEENTPAEPQVETPSAPEGGDVEKAGRKISAARISRLKKLLDELKGFIEEVDSSQGEKKADASEAPKDKLDEIEDAVVKISEALGIKDDKDGKDTPALAETVQNLTKRLDALEGVPGERTSLDGQEKLADEEGKKSIWKGMV